MVQSTYFIYVTAGAGMFKCECHHNSRTHVYSHSLIVSATPQPRLAAGRGWLVWYIHNTHRFDEGCARAWTKLQHINSTRRARTYAGTSVWKSYRLKKNIYLYASRRRRRRRRRRKKCLNLIRHLTGSLRCASAPPGIFRWILWHFTRSRTVAIRVLAIKL